MADVQLDNLYGIKWEIMTRQRLNGFRAHGATAWITANPFFLFQIYQYRIHHYCIHMAWNTNLRNEEVNCRYCQISNG